MDTEAYCTSLDKISDRACGRHFESNVCGKKED